MDKIKILFICNHNSARSQMAEAFLNNLAGDMFYAESAGFEPGVLNPLVVKAMQETGIDISGKQTNKVFDYYKQGRIYDFVITVCDESQAERCPVFPGRVKRLHWSFEDPSQFTGTHDEMLEKTRTVRDKIKKEIEQFIKQF
jgi:arsenate reductase (thioredoxin)